MTVAGNVSPRDTVPQPTVSGCAIHFKETLMSQRSTRRQFFGQAAGIGVGLALPASSWARVAGAGDKLRVASIGVGGKGWSDLTATAASPHVQVVALCDIDESKKHMGT